MPTLGAYKLTEMAHCSRNTKLTAYKQQLIQAYKMTVPFSVCNTDFHMLDAWKSWIIMLSIISKWSIQSRLKNCRVVNMPDLAWMSEPRLLREADLQSNMLTRRSSVTGMREHIRNWRLRNVDHSTENEVNDATFSHRWLEWICARFWWWRLFSI